MQPFSWRFSAIYGENGTAHFRRFPAAGRGSLAATRQNRPENDALGSPSRDYLGRP